MNRRQEPIPKLCRCACGDIIIAKTKPPGQSRFWCRTCVAFVEEITGRPADGRVTLPAPEMLPMGMTLDLYLANLELSLISEAMRRAHHSPTAAARLLGINRTTLIERLKRQRLSGMRQRLTAAL